MKFIALTLFLFSTNLLFSQSVIIPITDDEYTITCDLPRFDGETINEKTQIKFNIGDGHLRNFSASFFEEASNSTKEDAQIYLNTLFYEIAENKNYLDISISRNFNNMAQWLFTDNLKNTDEKGVPRKDYIEIRFGNQGDTLEKKISFIHIFGNPAIKDPKYDNNNIVFLNCKSLY